MIEKNIKPIPQYIKKSIQRLDRQEHDNQSHTRFYSYLTTIKKELVKITVAVRNYKKQWYCKQVAVHGVNSHKGYVRDMEYCYIGYGFRVGWHEEGLTKRKAYYYDGIWYDADIKYYNPYAVTVNIEHVEKFPEFKYSAYQNFNGCCIIEYLRLYKQYPQAEYLLKLGLNTLVFSKTILRRIAKDKQFCKWLIGNRKEIAAPHYYIGTIMQAYKSGKPLQVIQKIEHFKKTKLKETNFKPLRDLFKGGELEQLITYLEEQDTDLHSYADYLTACKRSKSMRKARMRTIRESLALLKEMDSETAIKYNFIRRLCESGKIKSFTLGKKILLNYDELLEYLEIKEE